jgi:hypothetical protein
VRTGRLLKFSRPGGDIQAYVYREGAVFCASVFQVAGASKRDQPLQTLTAATEAAVEQALRAWIDAHYPKKA